MTPEEIISFKDMIECLKRANEEIENLKLGNYIKEKYDDEVLLKIIHETYKEEIKSIEDRYISKDKIRHILLKFQNKYGEDLETTDRLFIGKEVVQYGEDMLDEIAKELDIKLVEE